MEQSFLENVPPPQKFWSKANSCPDLVSRLHVQVKLMGNFGLNAEVPWFYDTESRALFVLYAKKMRTTLVTFFLNAFRDNVEAIWFNLRQKIISTNHPKG